MSYCKPGTTMFPGAAGCQKCDGERLEALVKKTGDWTDGFGGMIVCATCGNKRCPKATFHGNECTGSNAPNQPGSSYQYCRCEWADTDDRWEGRPSKINPACTVEGHHPMTFDPDAPLPDLRLRVRGLGIETVEEVEEDE